MPGPAQPPSAAFPASRTALLTCPLDCPDACRLKVTIGRSEAGEEQLLSVTGDSAHPYTQGFACAKTVHYPARQYHPERPLQPFKRVWARFPRLESWDLQSSAGEG